MTEIEPLVADDYGLPAVPASASALIFDSRGRLLILRPTYKSGWTIPGGVMESGGETPWQACQREVREECGLAVTAARLACVDFRKPRPNNPGGLRFLFDCGPVQDASLQEIALQPAEISEYLFVPLTDALALLRKPVRRRLRAVLRPDGRVRRRRTVYLEEGRLVPAVRAA
jgi:8-oxo-dGTP pyrophosphatase MutT (NUDIX family)